MRIHLLDMGRPKYGDCLLLTQGERTILIDGGHPGDTARIRAQLKQLLGHDPPFAVDLLVVTHCHSDHIGCLPALVESGEVTAKTALVADEKLGWGRSADGTGRPTPRCRPHKKCCWRRCRRRTTPTCRPPSWSSSSPTPLPWKPSTSPCSGS